MHIIVTTPKSKRKESEQEAIQCIENGGGFYFRRFSKKPKNLRIGSKIFYVEDGFVRGFAIVDFIKQQESQECSTTLENYLDGTYAFMRAESWKWIEPIHMKGFQGYRYFDKDYKVVGDWLEDRPKAGENDEKEN